MKTSSGLLGGVVLAILATGGVFLWSSQRGQPSQLEVGLARQPPFLEGERAASEEIRILVPVFRQNDERWAAKRLGPGRDTIGGYGCTLCCVAMALGAYGVDFEPDALNDRLMEVGGFTENSLLIWGAVSKVTASRFSVEIQNQPDHEEIRRELARGNPVIAKVLYDNRIYHWVLVTGQSEEGYLIADPLGDGEAHETMAAYPSGIFAVRYLKVRR